MKIIQIITRLIAGGAQRIALETACDMASRGCGAEIWCGPQEGAEGSLAAEAISRGVRVVRIEPLVKQVDPFRDARALREIEARLRDARPDLVHTHSSKAGIVGRIAADRAGIGAILHTIHGWGWSERTPSPARWVFAAAERAAAMRADRLIAVSRAARDEGLRLGIGSPERYAVVHPGIELGPFADLGALRAQGRAVREALGIPGGAIVVGAVARLAPQKDPLLFVEAAIAAHDVHLLLVGDGPLRPRVEARAREAGVASRVHLAGRQSDPVPYLGAMDLFALTSRYEGFPLALIEARAAGLPIVAADVGGVGEILPDGPAGWRFPAGDAAAFRRAVKDASRERAAARAAAERLREEAMERFSLRAMLDSVASLYSRALGHPLPAPRSRG